MKTTKKVGQIGDGHFGSALRKRIKDKTGLEVNISKGKGRNVEVAEDADILILAVRPNQVMGVMLEIRGRIKEDAIIVSFAAAVPKSQIRSDVTNTVVRAMTDIEFEQVIGEDNDGTNDLLSALSSNSLIKAANEESIDIFTALIGCLPGVAAWRFANNEDAGEWLESYFDFIRKTSGVSQAIVRNICKKVWAENESGEKSFADKVAEVKTKGGVTEALIEAMQANASVTFEELLKSGMDRMSEIQRQLLRKQSA